MILCGHSMGGFLGCAYALTYPDRVQHLILADAWGMAEKPADVNTKYNVPIWVKAIAFAVQPLNPLWVLRAAGPWGQWVVEKTRPDIMKKFNSVVQDEKAIPTYIHQCNVQNPTGESAFHSMMSGFGWAKNPMIKRIHEIRHDVPITLLYGSRSWVDSSGGEHVAKLRPNSYVQSHIINQAGHHIYADRAEEFNRLVVEACRKLDDLCICDDESTTASSIE
jgi:pimeloyl-ACP methyl ester carboxylesterase